ncbi:hypothetical protein FKV73_02455 [Weissella paramesenteroides]|nr:hypothetical protein FKV79_05015 [Weissella paramesenteroides]KAA8438549.1 hypothetical protein FKV73_02455 [Weissella paramesenteroides]
MKHVNLSGVGSSIYYFPPVINLTFPNFFKYTKEKKKGNDNMNPEIIALGTQLAAELTKNSASVVNDKIKAAKAQREDKQTIAELIDLVQELVSEKQGIQSIAQAYEKEIAAQQLSQQDIDFISETVVPVIEKLGAGSMEEDNLKETMDIIKPLLSPTTLRVMQILGFNFKKAVGEPLTNLSNEKIRNLGDLQNSELEALVAQRDIEYFKVIQDPEAYARMRENH